MSALPYRRTGPCGECPWRKDTEPGKFSAERYEALAATSEQITPASVEDIYRQIMFACHLTQEGREQACAGWLAVSGHEHLGIRLAVAQGDLPAEALDPGTEWPELFACYADMAAAQAGTQEAS